MEVDHYNPRLKRELEQDYLNLLLATRHCNLSKWTFWPNRSQSERGLYVINPCNELDYGKHIFEDPVSHYLWGATATGTWHIRKLDLNAPHLVRERQDRADLLRGLRSEPFAVKPGTSFDELREPLAALRCQVEKMIPEWQERGVPDGVRPPR